MIFERIYSNDFCSRRFKAIADPARWAVIVQLMNCPQNVAELNASLKMEPTLLSHHLKILRDEGLVEAVREGKNKRYHLSPDVQLNPRSRGINLGCCRLELNLSRKRSSKW